MCNYRVVIKIDEGARKPVKMTKGASGWDIHAKSDEVVPAGGIKLVQTGISMKIPQGFEAQIRSRSGLALKSGIIVLNSPGTIDSDYTGEIGVILFNTTSEPFHVAKGMRVAQMVFAKVEYFPFAEVDDMSPYIEERGSGGFGSTGC